MMLQNGFKNKEEKSETGQEDTNQVALVSATKGWSNISVSQAIKELPLLKTRTPRI